MKYPSLETIVGPKQEERMSLGMIAHRHPGMGGRASDQDVKAGKSSILSDHMSGFCLTEKISEV